MKHKLVGQKYVFEDGNTIEIVQVNPREVNNENTLCVTYKIYQGTNLPRKLIMPIKEFIGNYGQLFNIESDDIQENNS